MGDAETISLRNRSYTVHVFVQVTKTQFLRVNAASELQPVVRSINTPVRSARDVMRDKSGPSHVFGEIPLAGVRQ